jgi:inosine-uridine nucleoside N-ribohydrolase
MAPRLHVDTDGGVDDALALVALAHAGADIQSVSAVFGNTWVDQAAANARWMLRLSGVAVDVYIGAPVGLAHRPFERRRPGHGLDGMNGQGGSSRRKLPLLERPHGAGVMAMAARHGITGVFIGPLTNLAQALLGDPRAFHLWRPIVMAGAFEVAGQGQGGADFNTWSDPEAMQRVLAMEVHPRLVPLDVTSQVMIERRRFDEAMSKADTPLMRLLAKAASPYIDVHSGLWGGDGCRPHDAVAAAVALWPELFSFEPAALELDPARPGRLRRTNGKANAEVCVGLEAPVLAERLASALFG